MPKIQGPNSANSTDPVHPVPACCAEDRIVAVARAIRQDNPDPDVRILLYINSARVFPYYRTFRSFSSSMFLHHRNGTLLQDHVHSVHPNGKIEWDYFVPYGDWTNPAATRAFLSTAKSTLEGAKDVIDGVFADTSGDIRTSGPGDWYLNQSSTFIQSWDAAHASLLSQLQTLVSEVIGDRGLLVCNNADRPSVLGRNFEVLSPGPSPYDVNDGPQHAPVPGDAIEAIQHEEDAQRVSLIRGGYYTAPGSAGWKKGFANCLPPTDRSVWDEAAAHIFNRTLAAFLVGAGEHSHFQCTPGYVGDAVYRASFDYPELHRPLGQPLGVAVNMSGVWSRQYTSGTIVHLDSANWSRPCIHWGDGSITGRISDCKVYGVHSDP